MAGFDNIWAVIPAAGRGTRFGGEIPKQYLDIAGRPLIAHALDALLAHPRVCGAVVALAADDERWPGWTTLHGKPVLRCAGGGERADSVLAALHALPAEVTGDSLVLVVEVDNRRAALLPRYGTRSSARTASCALRPPSRAMVCGAR